MHDDRRIVQSVLDGNRDDFSILFYKYKRLIYGVVNRFTKDCHEADDMFQDIIIRVYRALESYNPDYMLSTWITKLARNLCVTVAIAGSRKAALESLDAMLENGLDNRLENRLEAGNDATPEGAIIRKETTGKVRAVVKQLPVEYRTPILLYYMKGFSYKETACIMKVPMSIVKNRIYRARIIIGRKLPAN